MSFLSEFLNSLFMKNVAGLFALFFVVALSSCSTQTFVDNELSASEQNLLSAINGYRASLGKEALQPSSTLIENARNEANRRISRQEGYVDIREKTGYERMLTLAGTARAGEGFAEQLMQVWQKNPIQREWLKGSYSGVGVGTATAESGLQAGVLLLGGFSADGI